MQQAASSLTTLPEAIRPVYFSEDEIQKGAANKISDEKRFESFKSENPLGYFLRVREVLYNVNPETVGYSSIDLYLPEEYQSYIPTFFEVMSGANPVFGYAADDDERKHRNRFYITFGVNHVEYWVGRDLSKYISGLYCYTILSDALLAEHNIDLRSITTDAVSVKDFAGGTIHLVQYYEKTEEWREHASKLDGLCNDIEGIFSIKRVEEASKGVETYLDFDDVIGDWD